MGDYPPYGAPSGYPGGTSPPPQGYRRSTKVGQVPVVAILMIVQGALVGAVGLLFVVMGPAMFVMMDNPAFQTGPGLNRDVDRSALSVMAGVYVVIGLFVLVVGLFNVIGGVRGLKYRGRTMSIVAMAVGLAAVFTCYCAPTAIGLFIYGLIVYLNDDVKRAFEMGEQGLTPDQIKAAFQY